MSAEPQFEPEKLAADLSARARSVASAAARDLIALQGYPALAAAAETLARAAAAVADLSSLPNPGQPPGG